MSLHCKGDTHTQFFPLCCIQCHLHVLPFFESIWTFSWLFWLAAVIGPISMGSCLPFSWWKSGNQSHCNLKSKVKMSILHFGLHCWSFTMQNLGNHYSCVHKIPQDALPCFDWEVANIVFHTQLIMMLYTIHVPVVQLNVLWLIYLITWGPNFLSVWTTNLWFGFVVVSLTILLSYQTLATKYDLPS